MGRLDGKRLIVTGGGSGIGRASAKLFAEEGARVVAVDISEGALETATDIGEAAIGVQADVADEQAVVDFVARCVDAFGGVDGIYANAGVGGGQTPLVDSSTESWHETLRVNLIGPFLAIKHVAPHLIEQKQGSIVCTASTAGLRANAGGSAYSCSKAGVVSLVQTAAYEFYGTGVRVNAVCPGLIETGMTKSIYDACRERGTLHRIGQINPLARGGEPIEIAQMVAFLLSDAASYVNGQAIPVDGGLSASHPWVYPRKREA